MLCGVTHVSLTAQNGSHLCARLCACTPRRCSSLKRELSLARQTEEEMAKKVNVYQKTIQTLLSKLSALDATQQVRAQHQGRLLQIAVSYSRVRVLPRVPPTRSHPRALALCGLIALCTHRRS